MVFNFLDFEGSEGKEEKRKEKGKEWKRKKILLTFGCKELGELKENYKNKGSNFLSFGCVINK